MSTKWKLDAWSLWEVFDLYRDLDTVQYHVAQVLDLNGHRLYLDDFKRASEAELIDIHNVLAVADNAWWERNDIDPAESQRVRKELLNLRARSDAKRIFDAEQAESDEQLERLRRRLVADSDVDDLPEPGWVIDRVIPANGLVVPYGPPKGGKTFVTMDQAMCVATGIPWAPSDHHNWGGGFTVTQGPVVYVMGEGAGGLKRRRRAWLEHHKLDDAGDISWITCPVNLSDPNQVKAFIDLAGPLEPVLAVFDTLARNSGGIDENLPQGMSAVIEGIDRIREETEATVMPPHHTGKDLSKGLRGHSALHGALDASYEITRQDRKITWRCKDMKDAAEPSPMTFDIVDAASSVALTVGAPPGEGGDGNLAAVARAAARAVKAHQDETGERPTQRMVVERMIVRAGTDTKRAGLDYAVDLGLLNRDDGPRRSLLYSCRQGSDDG